MVTEVLYNECYYESLGVELGQTINEGKNSCQYGKGSGYL